MGYAGSGRTDNDTNIVEGPGFLKGMWDESIYKLYLKFLKGMQDESRSRT